VLLLTVSDGPSSDHVPVQVRRAPPNREDALLVSANAGPEFQLTPHLGGITFAARGLMGGSGSTASQLVGLSSKTQGVSGEMMIQDPPGDIGEAACFSVELQSGEGPAAVKLIGELDVSTAPQLEACLEELGADGADVRLDLSGLSFCDSSGISAMVTASKRVRKHGGHLYIVSPQPAVRSVLEITGLLDYLSAPQSEEGIDRQ
jgi:anti-sigma B factor antagonist